MVAILLYPPRHIIVSGGFPETPTPSLTPFGVEPSIHPLSAMHILAQLPTSEVADSNDDISVGNEVVNKGVCVCVQRAMLCIAEDTPFSRCFGNAVANEMRSRITQVPQSNQVGNMQTSLGG